MYFHFLERVKPKSTAIHLWMHNTTRSRKHPIFHIRTICLVSFKISFRHSSSFDFLTLYFNLSLQVTPILTIGIGVGRLHLVCISSQLWFYSIYSPPTSNWPWYHPVGRLHSVCFLVRIRIDLTFSLTIYRWTWIHPVTLQMLKTTSKYNFPPKLFNDIYFFSVDTS